MKAVKMKPLYGFAVVTAKGNSIHPMWKLRRDAQRDLEDLSKSRKGLRIARVEIREVK